ncbi:MAG: bifunctional phosphopantothenoylcysteine decarboxylase/phosphopantothenate--cysteine ligase CoaBC [Cyanobacteria bacterium P01_F01_bin.3]
MNVLIGITGGIAAYKICEVTSTLAKAGVEVRVLMTAQAQSFVSALTFAALSRHRVYTDEDFWSAQQGRPLHIELGEWADVFLIAPLSANTLGKLAHGLADNLLTNTVLASTCPILLAPAMNTDMWQQATVQRNWQLLCKGSHQTSGQTSHEEDSSRIHTVGPAAGRLACDRIGTGRMAEPNEIVTYIHSLSHTHGRRDLQNKHLLISTGSTREFIDPVRFIGNPATGRMGIALAQAAWHRGANVTLVHGPLSTERAATIPDTVTSIATVTAADMETAMLSHLPQADWVIMSAAVADMRPTTSAPSKLPKKDLPNPLPLAPVPDIVAQLSAKKSSLQKIIGFAAQTGDIIPPAIDKLKRKQLDAIVANPIDKPNSGFGTEENEAVILLAQSLANITPEQDPLLKDIEVSQTAIKVPHGSKLSLAHQLYDTLIRLNAGKAA